MTDSLDRARNGFDLFGVLLLLLRRQLSPVDEAFVDLSFSIGFLSIFPAGQPTFGAPPQVFHLGQKQDLLVGKMLDPFLAKVERFMVIPQSAERSEERRV